MLKVYVRNVERSKKDDWLMDYVFCSNPQNALLYADEATAKFDCSMFVCNGGVRIKSEEGTHFTIHEFHPEPFKEGWVLYCSIPFRPTDEGPTTSR